MKFDKKIILDKVYLITIGLLIGVLFLIGTLIGIFEFPNELEKITKVLDPILNTLKYVSPVVFVIVFLYFMKVFGQISESVYGIQLNSVSQIPDIVYKLLALEYANTENVEISFFKEIKKDKFKEGGVELLYELLTKYTNKNIKPFFNIEKPYFSEKIRQFLENFISYRNQIPQDPFLSDSFFMSIKFELKQPSKLKNNFLTDFEKFVNQNYEEDQLKKLKKKRPPDFFSCNIILSPFDFQGKIWENRNVVNIPVMEVHFFGHPEYTNFIIKYTKEKYGFLFSHLDGQK